MNMNAIDAPRGRMGSSLVGRGTFEAIADKHAAPDGHRDQDSPGRRRDSVPVGRLGVALLNQDIIHAGNGQSGNRRRLRRGWATDGGPQLVLQLRSAGIDLLKLVVSVSQVEQNPLFEIFSQQRSDVRRIGGRQQSGLERIPSLSRWLPPPRRSYAGRNAQRPWKS